MTLDSSSTLRHRRKPQDGSSEDPSRDETDEERHHFQLQPLLQRPLYLRLDVYPFASLYLLCIGMDMFVGTSTTTTDTDDKDASNYTRSLVITIVFGMTLLGHLILILASLWNIHIQAWVGYTTSISTPKLWTHALVQSDDESGIVPMIMSNEDKVWTCRFHYRTFRRSDHHYGEHQQQQQLWKTSTMPSSNKTVQDDRVSSSSCSGFRTLRYPTHYPLAFYKSWKGQDVTTATIAGRLYGLNRTVLELPSFGSLLKEQLTAPFFLFQILCVILWSLDEYWYYALYTLVALLIFESTVAYNRLHSLQRLRQAGHAGQERVWVRRRYPGSEWIQIPTRELVPGDIVSLQTSLSSGAMSRKQQSRQCHLPADILLLQGTAVCDEALLTGESIPQLKHAIDLSGKNCHDNRLDMDDAEHKESILFAGTDLLVSTPDSTASSNNGPTTTMSPPPDRGVVGFVLRTGFETAQGSLLRTMAHSAKSQDGVHTWDTFIFIFLLILFAFGAAGWVLEHGWNDDRRNRFRLVLHVIMIVTSVVPPELPMELSLAVTNSVADLMRRCNVYCTEHFRIPLAGEVNVCCFDKTGTLTSDEMRLRGVRLWNKENDGFASELEESTLVMPDSNEGSEVPWETRRVMAACHSLATAGLSSNRKSGGANIVGDPLEQAVLRHTGYILNGSNMMVPGESVGPNRKTLMILHRFAFSSKLKRMTVLVTEEGANNEVWALCKGAPETIKEFLTAESTPSKYDDIATFHMSRGRRVLSMAFRKIGVTKDVSKLKDKGRESIERDLTFAGFLILDCPIKPDTKSVISELTKSGHNVVMITGDAILTAAEVAKQVGILKRKISNEQKAKVSASTSVRKVFKIQRKTSAEVGKSNGTDVLAAFECTPLLSNDTTSKSLTLPLCELDQIKALVTRGEASLCVTGDTLSQIAKTALYTTSPESGLSPNATLDEKHMLLDSKAQVVLSRIVPLVSVFARHAPHQKEAVVAAFNRGGFHTLMCGDGTNDVGALKRAHVGISIISAPEVESKQRAASEHIRQTKKANSRSGSKRKASLEESMQRLREAQEELDHVELGDASVAAPFTSRAVSIKCCKDVIQQGRCTLVSMLSIYKILGINCLVNGLVLSKLFMHGVKQGDRQLTILGMVIAALFFFVTKAQPLSSLSSIRPPPSVLCTSVLCTISGQFVIHAATILVITEAGLLFVDPYDPSLVPDGPFNPNVLNTCTFLLTCLTTINTFAVNYRGRPFMKDLRENKLLFRSLAISYSALFICVIEAFPPLNDLLQLTLLPTALDASTRANLIANSDLSGSFLRRLVVGQSFDFRVFVCVLMIVDTMISFSIERSVISRFEGKDTPQKR